MDYFFKPSALRELRKLPAKIQKSIVRKLDSYTAKPFPLKFADKLTDHRFGEWRFRIGDYRVIFDLGTKSRIIVLRVGHRKDVYR